MLPSSQSIESIDLYSTLIENINIQFKVKQMFYSNATCAHIKQRFRDLTGCKADRSKEDCKVQTMSVFMWGITAHPEAGKYFSFDELSQCVMSS